VFWEILRLCARRIQRLRDLLEPNWRTVDQLSLALVVVVQFALAATALWPDVAREILPAHEHEIVLHIAPLWLALAWAVLGFLVAALMLALWGNWVDEAISLLWIVALSVPLLVAMSFRQERATASALRWAMAIDFLGCSALLWARVRCQRLAQAIGMDPPRHPKITRELRTLLLVLGVAPLLLLTGWFAVRGFARAPVPGPEDFSIFARMGWTASMVIPLSLIVLGLTGHGVREDSAPYVFAAGQVLLAAVSGGYALGTVTSGAALGNREMVTVVQLGVLASSSWGLAWIWSGRWRRMPLLLTQAFIAAAGGLGLLLTALVVLLIRHGTPLPAYWIQIGRPLGWLAWSITALTAFGALRLIAPNHVIHVLGTAGLGAGCLAAFGTVGRGSDRLARVSRADLGMDGRSVRPSCRRLGGRKRIVAVEQAAG
jgi:hypothetical protein